MSTANPFRHLALDQLHESPYNPRRHYDAKALAELADSIKAQGVLEPILVRPNAEGFEIVAGSRRYRAAKKAGLAEIPALVRDLTDEQALEAAVVENLQRADIHPLDEANGYQTLIDKTGLEVEAIAAKIGKSVSYVYQRLKLRALTDKAQKAFAEDKLTAGHAILIARLQPKDQAEAMIAVDQENMSVRDLGEWIEENLHLDLDKAPFEANDPQLVPGAGTCSDCLKRTGSQPELFPEIKRGDICTDRACFKAKTKAHTGRLVKEAKAAGTKTVEIAIDKSWTDKKNVLTERDYKIVSQPCPTAKLGVVVDVWDRNRDQLGTTRLICDNQKCEKHWKKEIELRKSTRSAARPNKPTATVKAEKQKAEAEKLARAQAIAQLLPAIAKKPVLDVTDLRHIAGALEESCWPDDALRPVCEHLKLKKIGNFGGYGAALDKALKTATPVRASEIILGILVCDDNNEDHLPVIAARYKVNLTKLRNEALAALKAKDEAAAVTKKPAKAKTVQTSAKSAARKPAKVKASAKTKPRKKAAKKPK